ncbi:MAG TPA: hypothetical protein VMW17_10205, partial [Candidatus Binatia bacterium]|nr:hypothetical protein [Candidatus Binatia bacterium]
MTLSEYFVEFGEQIAVSLELLIKERVRKRDRGASIFGRHDLDVLLDLVIALVELPKHRFERSHGVPTKKESGEERTSPASRARFNACFGCNGY